MISSAKFAGRRLLRGVSAVQAVRSTSNHHASTRDVVPPSSAHPSIRIRRFAPSDASTAAIGGAVGTSRNAAAFSSVSDGGGGGGGGGGATTTAMAAASGGENDGGGSGPLGRVFFSSLCLLTFGLGSWQTRRYFEKVKMVEKREHDLSLDPIPTFDEWRATKGTTTTRRDGDGKSTSDAAPPKSYRRVRLRGEYRHGDEILIGPRGPPPGALAESGPNSGRGGGGGMSSSAQGYLVVTPFAIVSRDAVPRPRGTASASGLRGDEVARSKEKKRGWFGRLLRGDGAGGSSSVSGSETAQRRQPSTDDDDDDAKDDGRTIVWIHRGWIPRHHVNNRDETVASWDRPRGIVDLTAMESDTEKGGTFAPPSRLGPESDGKRLLWMDRIAMEELTSCGEDRHPHLFVEINTADERHGVPPSFPARAGQEFVGEFKVTPAIHAGYAFTWFGLSSAGIVMTRKFLSRGR